MVAHSEFNVTTSVGSYDVRIGSGGFLRSVAGTRDVVIVDSAVRAMVPQRDAPVLVVEASEHTKTLAGCERLILELRQAGVRRGDRVLAVGGGVVQDVATFVSDVYMRGLAWSYVPTTLMAMADSCIGGKSSINVGEVKNLVGGIYPPESVIIDPVFLASLSGSAIAAGLSEAVKIAYCRGPEAFNEYLWLHARFAEDPAALIEHVLLCKRWFVEVDEHDQLERRLLNFGHTFGHAVESAVDHRLSHGLAVAFGVLCAINHPLSAKGPLVNALGEHCRSLLAGAGTVDEALLGFDWERFEQAFRADKKHSADAFRLILPAPDGGVAEVETGATAKDWDVIAAVTRQTIDTALGEHA